MDVTDEHGPDGHETLLDAREALEALECARDALAAFESARMPPPRSAPELVAAETEALASADQLEPESSLAGT